MAEILVCVRGFRTTEVLDRLDRYLDPATTWTILHVIDSRPREEVERAVQHLPGIDARSDQTMERFDAAANELHARVRQQAGAWFAERQRDANFVLVEGRPEVEILRIAEQRGATLIALGDLTPPGPARLSPVVQHVVDHASCDVLLVR